MVVMSVSGWHMVVIVSRWCCDFNFCLWTTGYDCYFSFWTVYLFSKFVICENEYCDKLGYVMNMGCWAADFSNIL
jgi:hypothetical protein